MQHSVVETNVVYSFLIKLLHNFSLHLFPNITEAPSEVNITNFCKSIWLLQIVKLQKQLKTIANL